MKPYVQQACRLIRIAARTRALEVVTVSHIHLASRLSSGTRTSNSTLHTQTLHPKQACRLVRIAARTRALVEGTHLHLARRLSSGTRTSTVRGQLRIIVCHSHQ